MGERLLKWTIDLPTGLLTCKHKESQTKQTFDLTLFWTSVEWNDLEEVEKYGAAYCIQQKLSDFVAGKGKKAGYSAAEIFALMKNRWDALTVDRVWSQKSGERGSLQKKITENLSKVDLSKVPPEVLEALRAAGVKGL